MREVGSEGVNRKIAVAITGFVGSMKCAYLFTLIALVSLPAAIQSGNVIVIVGWVAQTFLQLVLLSVIMVGGSIQAEDAEKRHDAMMRKLLRLEKKILADEDEELGRTRAKPKVS